VKTQYASEERGIDGGKKVKGHKRHIVVDILGNLLYVTMKALIFWTSKTLLT
jgi:putative transposase